MLKLPFGNSTGMIGVVLSSGLGGVKPFLLLRSRCIVSRLSISDGSKQGSYCDPVVVKRSRSRSGSRSRSPVRRDRDKGRDRGQDLRRSPSRSPSHGRERHRSPDYRHVRQSRSRSYTPSRSRSPSRHRRSNHYDDSRSRSPRRRRSRSPPSQVLGDDEVTEQFIRTVASEVKGHDEEYEKTLQEREKSNPKYAFLNKEVSQILS